MRLDEIRERNERLKAEQAQVVQPEKMLLRMADDIDYLLRCVDFCARQAATTRCDHEWHRTGEFHPMTTPLYFVHCLKCDAMGKQYELGGVVNEVAYVPDAKTASCYRCKNGLNVEAAVREQSAKL